jgi:hypothetical protein
MLRFLRRVGIAIGSLTIAYLALALVGGIIGLDPGVGIVGVIAVLAVGALIYQDIISRETRAS